ncbi:hypothetical protein IQ06DRAFT_31720 [Phaeosphaeriaceae sp. SRC1lsM3a]|nr:hypothetical protein IQ06DRAFT_31720 [Stagonospora sp. SRC1lsM3a]
MDAVGVERCRTESNFAWSHKAVNSNVRCLSKSHLSGARVVAVVHRGWMRGTEACIPTRRYIFVLGLGLVRTAAVWPSKHSVGRTVLRRSIEIVNSNFKMLLDGA